MADKSSFRDGDIMSDMASFLQAPLWIGLCCLCHGHSHPLKDLGEAVIFIGHRLLAKFYARCEVLPSPIFSIDLLDSYREFIFAFKLVGIE